jgi:hypothetical protein
MKSKKAAPNPKTVPARGVGVERVDASFAEIVSLIEQSRTRAYRAVNSELVNLYWQIGQYISAKKETTI